MLGVLDNDFAGVAVDGGDLVERSAWCRAVGCWEDEAYSDGDGDDQGAECEEAYRCFNFHGVAFRVVLGDVLVNFWPGVLCISRAAQASRARVRVSMAVSPVASDMVRRRSASEALT